MFPWAAAGLPQGFDEKMSDLLAAEGYNVKILGKTDWSAGGHSLNVRLNSWTMYVAATPVERDGPTGSAPSL